MDAERLRVRKVLEEGEVLQHSVIASELDE